MSPFHAKDGLSFERLEDGSVQVTVDAGPASFQTVLNQDTWSSVVASVSVFGDTARAWQEALNFHNGGREEDDTGDFTMG